MWWYSLKIKAFAPKSLIPTESKNTGGVETEIVSFSLIKVNHLRIPPFYFVYFWAAQIRTAVQMPRSQVKIPSSPPSSLSSYKLGHRPGPHLGIWTMHKISQVLQKTLLHKNELIFTWERTASDHPQCQSSQLFHHEREAQRVWVRSLLLCSFYAGPHATFVKIWTLTCMLIDKAAADETTEPPIQSDPFRT